MSGTISPQETEVASVMEGMIKSLPNTVIQTTQ